MRRTYGMKPRVFAAKFTWGVSYVLPYDPRPRTTYYAEWRLAINRALAVSRMSEDLEREYEPRPKVVQFPQRELMVDVNEFMKP